MKITIRKKLLGSFLIVLLFLGTLAGTGYFLLSTVDKTYNNLLHVESEKEMLILEMTSIINEQSKAIRGYLLIGDETSLQTYKQADQGYRKISEKVHTLLSTDKGKQLVGELDRLNDDYDAVVQKLITYKNQNNTAAYQQLIQTKEREVANQFIEKAGETKKFFRDYVDTTSQQVNEQVVKIKRFILIISILAAVVGIGIAFFVSRLISSPIITLTQSAKELSLGNLTIQDVQVKNRDEIGELALSFNEMKHNLRELISKISASSEQVAASSEELFASSEQSSHATNQAAASIEEVAGGAENQMRGMDETKRAVEENAIAVQRIAELTSAISSSAGVVLEEAQQGNEVIERTIKQMQTISVTVDDSAAVIRTLGESSQEIGQIVAAITQIAEQTNLLSLNAAIEAARAGEHGKGFAVVADEVRKLAEQSRQSTEQISVLIEEIQKNTSRAVYVMEKGTKEVENGSIVVNEAGQAFQRILLSVQQAAGEMQEVSAATEEVSASTEEITATVEQLAQVSAEISGSTQSVAASAEEQLASMEEITASADALSQLAQELQHEVTKFKL
ncbi:methyl-accepting chemotaxis protein [Aneurinibacillus sp. REN35]|uniref:methyl-accepting chemotaxis protein n=1 Tax=Aneurinibacillus sp. REN35 TaxID=3237286 RepID=UPI0035287524